MSRPDLDAYPQLAQAPQQPARALAVGSRRPAHGRERGGGEGDRRVRVI